MQKINVAVGVIYYQNLYLLSFRHAKQHQGNRYEFVGGKFEDNETPNEALIREVKEEIGIDISTNSHQLLGTVSHNYQMSSHQNIDDTKEMIKTLSNIEDSKTVCIHTYLIELSTSQFNVLSTVQKGCEEQILQWVTKSSLLDNQYKLPDANVAILDWLKNM